MVQPVLEATLEKTVDLDEDATEERTAALTPLNDTLQSAIGEVLFLRQREVAELVVQFYQHPPPHVDANPMAGGNHNARHTLAQWFQRKSPSRWMRDIPASPAEIRHTTSTAPTTLFGGLLPWRRNSAGTAPQC